MMARLRTVEACHRAAAEQFRRVSTPDLTPFERKVVHDAVADDDYRVSVPCSVDDAVAAAERSA